MSPVAINEPTTNGTADPAQLKSQLAGACTARKPLPKNPDAVAPDYMYKFKYNHELPLHGKEGVEIPLDTDAKSVATEVVSQLSEALSSGDANKFAGLFLEHGYWRDRVVFTWDYRTFNFRPAIFRAATDLFPRTPVSKVTLIDPPPTVERPYPDLSFVQAHIGFETDIVLASALVNIVLTPEGYKVWTLNTAIEGLKDFPEVPERDGHMTGPNSWSTQREIDTDLNGVEPEVVIVGGGQNGLMLAARLKALGTTALVIERNKRIGDNWRGRYEALSLHLPHWADHFPYMPYPQHWPSYCPAEKLGDWFEWYVSAMELYVWTNSTVDGVEQDSEGNWTVNVVRGGKNEKRVFHPKQFVIATSLVGVPYSPKIPGAEDFKGVIRHSSEHDSSREWVGKKVLVVGTSSSGFDTAFDFARRGIDVTMLQRSSTYIMSLTHSVPRLLSVYKADEKTGKRPDIDVADRIAHGLPVGPGEEFGRRLGEELTELDYDLLSKMEEKGFKTWRGQRGTSTQTLGYTKSGGFYFDAGACEQIINGNIKVEQGSIDHFTKDKVVLNGNREKEYDLVVLATGFSNTIDSVRRIVGPEIASKVKPIWGMDEEGELNSAWRDTGVKNMWIVVGTLQAARYHSKKIALRIKARLEGISPEPYLE